MPVEMSVKIFVQSVKLCASIMISLALSNVQASGTTNSPSSQTQFYPGADILHPRAAADILRPAASGKIILNHSQRATDLLGPKSWVDQPGQMELDGRQKAAVTARVMANCVKEVSFWRQVKSGMSNLESKLGHIGPI